MKFYLGTHMTNWLSKTDVPLFISARRLRTIKKKFHRASGAWALDSGGFSEISMYGEWRTSPEQYSAEVDHWTEQIGAPDWCAIQDWMCEPPMLEKTGKSVQEHQELTVLSYHNLKLLNPQATFMPVLQGWDLSDYTDHLEMYRSAGFHDVRFGLGSVCRRQITHGIGGLVKELHADGLKLHAFGFKTKALTGATGVADYLESSDSLAWSYAARYEPALPGHTHKNCANCLEFALNWRTNLLNRIED